MRPRHCVCFGASTTTAIRSTKSVGSSIEARTAAPDDDRVWLALADLATRTGRFDEASELLARCEQSRPDDPAVWRTRLRWALAANRADEVTRATGHLVAADFSKTEVLELRAWLAARAGDRQAEIGVLAGAHCRSTGSDGGNRPACVSGYRGGPERGGR